MAEFVVDTTADEVADDSRLSLREAVAQANATPEADRIVFASGPGEAFEGGGTIRLVQGTITIAAALAIDGDLDGDGQPDVTISGDAAGDDLTDMQGVTDIDASAGEGRLADNTRLFDITDPDGAVTLRGLALTGGAVSDPGEEGGAVRTLAPLTLAASHLVGNAATAPGAGGGAVRASFPQDRGKALTILDSRIEHNRSGGDGAGVDLYGGTVEILRSSLSHNRAGSEGAALYVNEGYTVVIRDSVLEGNAAANNSGGAVYFDARDETPGLYEMIVSDSRLSGNTAQGKGGAIEVADGALLLLRSEVLDNRAEGTSAEGGGIYVRDIVTVIDSRVAGNRASGDGGGIIQESSGGRMTVIRSEITDNIAGGGSFPGNGGGLLADGGPLFLVSSLVAGNSLLPGAYGGGGEGGGIKADEPAVIVASTISGNSVQGDLGEGGGIFSDEALTLVNATVAGNRADKGAGVLVRSAGEIVNSTLTGNLAENGGGGVFALPNTTLSIANSLVLGNASDAGANDLEGDQAFAGAALDTTGGGNLFGAAPAGFDTQSLGGGDAVIDGADAAALGGVFAMVGPDPATGVTAGLLGDMLGPLPVAGLAGTPANPAVDAGEGGAALGIFEGPFDDLDGDGTDGETLAFSEALIGADLNGDGDLDDVFATVADLLADARGLPRVVDGDGVGGAAPDLGAVEREAEAPGLTVTTAADVVDPADGETSLREAVGFVNRGVFPEGSEITFDAGPGAAFEGGGTIFLGGTGELAITRGLAIDGDLDGDGMPDVTLSADSGPGADDATSRVLTVSDPVPDSGPELRLTGLVIRDGAPQAAGLGDENGGGIRIGRDSSVRIEDSVISDNSGDTGGGIYADNGARLEILSSFLRDNVASGDGGGAFVDDDSRVVVTASTVSGNTAGGDGGGLDIDDDSTLTLTGSVVSGNSAGFDGGGIYGEDRVDFTLVTSLIANNTSGSEGGGVYVDSASRLTITSTTIIGNTAADQAGGVYVDTGSVLTVTGSTIADNRSDGALSPGGGLHTDGNTTVTISGTQIYGNATAHAGGGLSFTSGDRVTLSDVEVRENTAALEGGGISLGFMSELGISGSRIEGNVAGQNGGGLAAVEGTEIEIADTVIRGNESGASGGGISTQDAVALRLAGAEVAANDALFGGGLALDGTEAMIRETRISGNTANEGGGLYVSTTSRLGLADSEVTGNTVSGSAGGIAAYGGLFGAGVTISGNSAAFGGGGLASSGEAVLVNATIEGNSARDGGGLALFNPATSVTLLFSTITGNRATGAAPDGAGGGVLTAGDLTLVSSVLAGNASGGPGPDLLRAGDSPTAFPGVNLLGTAPETTGGAPFDLAGEIVLGEGNAFTLADVFAAIDPATGGGTRLPLGGPVETVAPAAAGPAVDAAAPGITLALDETAFGVDLNGDGDAADILAGPAELATDARGQPRDVDQGGGGTPDLGAVELQTPDTPSLTVTTAVDGLVPDDGLISLREAVGFVADGVFPAGSVIGFDRAVFDGGAEDVIRLTLGELAIPVSLAIDGDLDDDGTPDVVVSGDAAGDDTAPGGITDVAASAGALADNTRVISTAAGTQVTLDGLVVTGGRTEGDAPMFEDPSQSGAGIRALGDLVLRNGTVAGNSTTGENADGAGVFAGAGLTVTGSTIRGNIASGENSEGGGIRSRGDLLEVTGSAVLDNAAADQGGGLYAHDGASIADSVFSGNHSGLGGGGLFALSGITIRNTEITGNRMDGNGLGAAGVTLASGGTILDSTISGNVAGTAGTGGIDGSFDRLVILRSTVSDNTGAGSFESGGIVGGRILIADSTVSDNRVEADGARGGGISALFVTAVNTTIAGNAAEGEGARGGGVFAVAGADLVQSTLAGNRASGTDAQGGGLFDAGGDRPVTLANTLSLGNAAEGAGAAAPELATEGTLAFAGVNLVGADAAAFDAAGRAGVANADPAAVFALADPLADNGGPVGTAALAAAAANPALDAADPGVALGIAEPSGGDLDGDGLPGEILALSEAFLGADLNGDGDTGDVFATVADLWADARGLPRDVDLPGAGGTPDLGAYELQAVTIAAEAVEADRAEGDAGETPFTFRVTRSGETGGALALDYAVAGRGAAPAGAADFAGGALPAGEVIFAPGEAVAQIAVPVAGDRAVEPDEGFALALSDPGGLIDTGAPVAGTILNDDAPALLSIAGTVFAVPEGDSGTTEMVFTVTRSGNTGIAAEAAFAVVGTGVAPVDAADFGGTLPAGTVAFAPGETEREIVLLVSGDTDLEPDERFEVRLSAPSAGTEIAKDEAVGLIRNDEPVAVFDIAAVDAVRAEGDAGASAFTFTVTRTGSTAGDAAVSYLVSGTGADPAGAADFAGAALPEGRIDIADGEDSAVLTVEVAGDIVIEPDEGFEVDIQPIVGGSIGTGTATATILNDDVFGPVAQPEGVIRGTGRDDALAAGAGAIYLPDAGANTFLVSAAAAAGETGVFDSGAGDVVQLAGGLELVGFVLTPDALQIDLATGARVQVLNADLATFEPGGNVTTGAAGPALTLAAFSMQVLGAAVPAAGVVTGGAATVPEATGTDPVDPVAGPPAPPDGVIRGTERADTLLTGAGAIVLPRGGADTVLVSGAAAPGETGVVEGEAGDLVQLAAGLEIAEALLTPTALQLGLATGASVQILEADALLFEPGGNATTGAAGPALDYAQFADTVLGAPVPDTGVTTVGPLTIPEPTAPAPDPFDLLA